MFYFFRGVILLVYVDIDMDYLIKPVMKNATNNVRTYNNGDSKKGDPTLFVDSIGRKVYLLVVIKSFLLIIKNHIYIGGCIKNLI